MRFVVPVPTVWVPKYRPLRRPGGVRGSAHRHDRPVEPAHRLLERWRDGSLRRCLAACPVGRCWLSCATEPNGAICRCRRPRSSIRSSAHHGPWRPSARRRRSLAGPAWASAGSGWLRRPRSHRRESVKVASRSRSRNLNCSMRSARSMRRLRACWATHSPVGLAVSESSRRRSFLAGRSDRLPAFDQPTRTPSMDTEPPSNPSTGKVTGSSRRRCARTYRSGR